MRRERSTAQVIGWSEGRRRGSDSAQRERPRDGELERLTGRGNRGTLTPPVQKQRNAEGRTTKVSPKKGKTKGARAKSAYKDYRTLRALSEERRRNLESEEKASPSARCCPRREPIGDENTRKQTRKAPRKRTKWRKINRRIGSSGSNIQDKPRRRRRKLRLKLRAKGGTSFPTIQPSNGRNFEGTLGSRAQQILYRGKVFKGTQPRLRGRVTERWGNKEYLQVTKHTQAEGGPITGERPNSAKTKRKGGRLTNRNTETRKKL